MFDLESLLLAEIKKISQEEPLAYAKKLNNLLSSLEDCHNHCESRLATIPEIYTYEPTFLQHEKLSSDFLSDLETEDFDLISTKSQERIRKKIIHAISLVLKEKEVDFAFEVNNESIVIDWNSDPNLVWIFRPNPCKWPLIEVRTYYRKNPDGSSMDIRTWFLASCLIDYSLEKLIPST